MSILDELEESRKSDAPIYMEFLYRYDPKKKQVFAFYEGDEDGSFYQPILRKFIDSDCELEEIVAGCKNSVLKLHREFDWEIYNKKQIIFFVDRDLSYWLEEPTSYAENIFVTDEYSVENYVATPQIFNAWLTHFEGFARAKKQEIAFMISEYRSCVEIFKEKMMPIMAQAVVAKRHDKSVSLSELKITNSSVTFCMQDGHISFQIVISEKVLEKWHLDPIDYEEIEIQLKKFANEREHYSVRGKWLLRFLGEVGEYMRINSNLFAPSLGNTGKAAPTCSVTTAQCFSVLAPYYLSLTPELPDRLEDFLNTTYRCLDFLN